MLQLAHRIWNWSYEIWKFNLLFCNMWRIHHTTYQSSVTVDTQYMCQLAYFVICLYFQLSHRAKHAMICHLTLFHILSVIFGVFIETCILSGKVWKFRIFCIIYHTYWGGFVSLAPKHNPLSLTFFPGLGGGGGSWIVGSSSCFLIFLQERSTFPINHPI